MLKKLFDWILVEIYKYNCIINYFNIPGALYAYLKNLFYSSLKGQNDTPKTFENFFYKLSKLIKYLK